jgi:hypothetical protein
MYILLVLTRLGFKVQMPNPEFGGTRSATLPAIVTPLYQVMFVKEMDVLVKYVD